jgi:phosphoglycolate phosphatase-like HAD superfamily hydrolase
MNLKKKVLIFDFDGTLVDNTALGFQGINEELKSLGLEPLDQDFLKLHWGKEAGKLFAAICTAKKLDNEQSIRFAKYREDMSQYVIKDELIASLETLAHAGFFTGLLTSRTDYSLRSALRTSKLKLEIFKFLQTATHFYHHKPSGRVFGPLMNRLKVNDYTPEDILYFGDTINYDLAATRNNDPQFDFAGIVSGVNTAEEFFAAGVPKNQITTINELPNFLQQFM